MCANELACIVGGKGPAGFFASLQWATCLAKMEGNFMNSSKIHARGRL